MKRLVKCILLVAVLSTQFANAQDLGFGIKGGLNLTNLDAKDPEASYDSRAGYHTGLFLRAKFNKVGIQPEVLLFTQKAKGSFTSLGTIEESFTYLSVPVMFKFYPVLGLNLQVGPQFGFLLDGERKLNTIFGAAKQDIKDAYKSSDISVSVGGGYDFNFGLGLDVRYNIGIQDINNLADGEEVKSRIFLVSLGWNFLR